MACWTDGQPLAKRAQALLHAIRAQPGLHELALSGQLGYSRGSVRHHLRSLCRAGLVSQRQVANRSLCYASGHPLLHAPAALGDPLARDLVQVVARHGPLIATEIVRLMQAPRKVVRVRLAWLTSAGVLQRTSHARPTYGVASPASYEGPPMATTPEGQAVVA